MAIIISLVLFLISFALATPSGFCSWDLFFCGEAFGENVAFPIWFGSGILLLTFLFLLFLPEAIFHTWKKFAIVYIPLAAIWVGITGAGSSGSGLGADAEGILFFTSGLYGVITALIIFIKGTLIFLRNRKK